MIPTTQHTRIVVQCLSKSGIKWFYDVEIIASWFLYTAIGLHLYVPRGKATEFVLTRPKSQLINHFLR